MKILVCLLFTIFELTKVTAREAVIPDVSYFDCIDKSDGLYVHPNECTRYIHCDNGRAHDKSCAGCHQEPVTCPKGWLVFDFAAKECLWADEADATCTPPPVQCDPRNCTQIGDCQLFERCGDDGFLEEVECPADNNGHHLWWNSEQNEIHGGVCDLWDNLSAYIQNKYLNDHTCIEPCRYESDEPCSAKYKYFDGLPNGNIYNLECGVGLIFNSDPEIQTCDFCQNVKNNGNPCC